MEDVATFVQPLAMVPAEGNSRGSEGATLQSADLPGRPTSARDIQPPPLCCMFPLAFQDCEIQGTST